MYNDEYRSEEVTRQQRLKYEIADPERLYTDYIGLVARQGAKVVSQQEQLWEIERHDLKRRVSSAHSSLNSAKSDNERLRKQLTAVRNSNTMKLGQIVVAPARAVRDSTKRIKPVGSKVVSQLTRFDFKLPSLAHSDRKSFQKSVGPKVIEEQRSAVEFTRVDAQDNSSTPIDIFENTPNQRNFERALNFYWYNLGSISQAHEFILKNDKFVPAASDKISILIKRIAGDYKLFTEGMQIPERSNGVAFVAEPGRIMYTVHQTPTFNSNGYSTRTRGVAKGVVDAGGGMVVVGRSGYPWDSRVDVAKPAQVRFVDTIDGVQYVHNPGPNLSRDALDNYMNEVADTFVREARILRPSSIQSASNFRTAIPALIAARRVGVPFVYEVRGLWELTEASAKPGFEKTERFAQMKKLETLVAQQADRVLAITQEVAAELTDRGVDPKLISVIPNAVDPKAFVPIPKDIKFAESKKYDPRIPTIGFAGSFVAYEGLDHLLQASAMLTADGTEHQVVLAGSGAEEKNLKALTKELGLKNVYFLGRLPQDEVIRVMSTFDVVACPRKSTLITELVSPLKPLESFAAGIATVVSNVAPNQTLAGATQEPSRALLFPAGDIEALAGSLRSLLVDPDHRSTLARNARLWVVRERNWKSIGSMIIGNHRVATDFYGANTATGRELKEIKAGVIADEFTRVSLQATFDTVLIDRASWRAQLETLDLDFLFVESAWEGNGGQWHRGVGYYGEKENADLFELVAMCREKRIPTVFWNKEDPVHFQRFARTAAEFDHVFTTDANMISEYRRLEGSRNITVSSHSFYSQPNVHNPLPVDGKFSPTVAYAGTYYGDRYKDRSKRLDALLQSAFDQGIDIYDRQADSPDSPYKFPRKFQRFVRGALPYSEVIQTYKTHLAHMNVNSVEDSPSMFSRRVVEIPASGGVLMSAEGRGISETLGSVLAISNEKRMYNAWLYDWSTDPNAWFNERWLQMRAVFRAHTSTTALSILARTIGIPSVNPGLPKYALSAPVLSEELVSRILEYSVPPAAIVSDSIDAMVKKRLLTASIRCVSAVDHLESEIGWIGRVNPEATRTFYEDLLTAVTYGDWSFLDGAVEDISSYETPLVEVTDKPVSDYVLNRIHPVEGKCIDGVVFHMPIPVKPGSNLQQNPPRIRKRPEPRVLIAGHDLKFINQFIDYLEQKNLQVDTDAWAGHNQHDEQISKQKLVGADVIVCEWGLGNAVWYSRNMGDHQKLIVRVHSQELFLPYLAMINHDRVDAYVFVGELIRKAAVISHGVPEEKTLVIPNAVETSALDLRKHEDTEKTIGFVGMVPRSKRIDLAIDLLEQLHQTDDSYRLRIKGKLPSDYPWMQNRPEELAFYEEEMARIEQINSRKPGSVLFDEFGDDMHDWYQKIGIALSTSDFESFHFTIADGAASGAQPIALNWPGADLIYPEEWLYGSVEEMAEAIRIASENPVRDESSQKIIRQIFDVKQILQDLYSLVIPEKN